MSSGDRIETSSISSGLTNLDGRIRRGARTRHTLEKAALRLFVKKGFDETTIEEIAESAGVSGRTFFRHFATKEDVLVGDQAAFRESLARGFAARPEGEPVLESVKQALLTLAREYEDDRDHLLLAAQVGGQIPSVVARGIQHQRSWEDLIANYCAQRLDVDPNTDPRPRLIAGTTVVALALSIGRWVESNGQHQLGDLLSETLELTQDSFGLPGEPSR